MESNINRNLDGAYFRVERDGKWESICFSDLTENEMKIVMKDKDMDWLQSLAIYLGNTIKTIGNQFDLIGEE